MYVYIYIATKTISNQTHISSSHLSEWQQPQKTDENSICLPITEESEGDVGFVYPVVLGTLKVKVDTIELMGTTAHLFGFDGKCAGILFLHTIYIHIVVYIYIHSCVYIYV